MIMYFLGIIKGNTTGIVIEKIQYLYEMIKFRKDKSVRISFTNFWSGFYGSGAQDFFTSALKEIPYPEFKLVKYYNPHIQFFSVHGKIKKLKNSKAQVKIFYTGENVNLNPIYKGNCLNSVDLALGFDYSDDENYFRFPHWLLYFFHPANSKDDIRNILNNFKQPYQKTKFCSMIANHDNNGIRTKIYNGLSEIAHIDCPSTFLHNDNSLHKIYNNSKLLYLQQYKFNICPENSASPGYVTEKLFEA